MSTCPWNLALEGDFGPLCKYVCETAEVADDTEVVGALPCTPEDAQITHIEILLKKKKLFHYKIKLQKKETGVASLQASTILAQLIMADPLLLHGVTDFECSPSTSFIVFHGHTVDISPYFDGMTLQTSAVITEIIRKMSMTTTHVCSIGMVPITGRVAFLVCEDTSDGHRYYEEASIRQWVSEHGTAPFTREVVGDPEIRIECNPSAVQMNQLPSLPRKRSAIVTDRETSKKVRTVSNKHICAVWDRSGSMRSMGSAPLDGLKKVVADQQAIAASSGNPTKMSLYTFDNLTAVPVTNQDITKVVVEDAWIEPRGTTRLYDTIVMAAAAFKELVQDDESGVFIVMTDGADNASECERSTVKNALDSLPDNVECIFMAANIGDAQSMGLAMGFQAETSLTFSPEAASDAFESMSQSALRSVSGGSAGFTRLERQASVAPMVLRARTLF